MIGVRPVCLLVVLEYREKDTVVNSRCVDPGGGGQTRRAPGLSPSVVWAHVSHSSIDSKIVSRTCNCVVNEIHLRQV